MSAKPITRQRKIPQKKRAFLLPKNTKAMAVKSVTTSADGPDTAKTKGGSERVAHLMFGIGKVLKVDGDKLQIKFAKVGVKWIRQDFVKRAR